MAAFSQGAKTKSRGKRPGAETARRKAVHMPAEGAGWRMTKREGWENVWMIAHFAMRWGNSQPV
ncbi:hypothetical protein M493_15740 [Geobacillus genomosp. 3]|uniref:Uncharacterized protein n=1 Tax=Geobacillus genomosp. 3 TaxID=1921421 RepID=S5Z2U8_GEOG3|nr:hypothetical protein M493_15740 [Geobacillus genomosp. 3]